jgi:hypothetical protein
MARVQRARHAFSFNNREGSGSKIERGHMTPAQAVAAYRSFFNSEAPAALAELVALTPGDFAVVARQLRFEAADGAANDAILRMLEREVAVKNLPARRIGF